MQHQQATTKNFGQNKYHYNAIGSSELETRQLFKNVLYLS